MAKNGMTLQEIYNLAIEMGIAADPRGKEKIKKYLANLKKDYDELPVKKRKFFDPESLKNPYSDTRILNGDPQKRIRKVLAGIDADASEVLMMDRLNQQGQDFDLLISHHPSGHALVSLFEVMDIQVETFNQAGVPSNVAHSLLEERKMVVQRRLSALNHSQAVDTAKLLNVPLLAIHTVWDNLGHTFMGKLLQKKEFETVEEVLDYIKELPEYLEATKGKNPPIITAGSPKRRAGKVFVFFTGGTNPPKELYMELAKAGVGTILDMHSPEEVVTELKKLHMNIIDTGHMASDSIGANLFLDELEKRGVTVVACSGLIRVRRK